MSSADDHAQRSPIAVLDHVQLAAPPGCEAAARAFYGALLGLCELERPPGLRGGGGAWFALGGGQLHIGVQDPFAPARKAHPAIRLADEDALEALAARLRAAGVDVIWDHRIPEVRRFYTADPWGNRLELLAGDLPNRPLEGARSVPAPTAAPLAVRAASRARRRVSREAHPRGAPRAGPRA